MLGASTRVAIRRRLRYDGSMKKLTPIAIRLEPRERDALEQAARADDRALSAMARRIIAEWLREKGFLK